MTTRTEYIERLRNALGGDLGNGAADMLEADAVNDDLTIAYMSGFKAGEDKYKAAARLALDALKCTDQMTYEDWMRAHGRKAITALEDALK